MSLRGPRQEAFLTVIARSDNSFGSLLDIIKMNFLEDTYTQIMVTQL